MKVAIIMGSGSDLPVVEGAFSLLEKFSIAYEKRILSAHRTTEELMNYLKEVNKSEIQVVIAVAGKAAHLPGVVASLTHLPVIGVPVKTSMMGGMDSLLSIVQMPTGIPVATVGVNAGENAALLAARILALQDEKVKRIYESYVEKMKEKVLKEDRKLHE